MGIPRDVAEEVRGLQTEGRVKLTGIRVSGVTLSKGGKIKKKITYRSVSDRIRAQKSTKPKVVRKGSLP